MYREEKKQNEDICPGVDQKVIDIEVIKEHIIDLNDKFDYLVNLMIKNKKIAVIKKKDEEAEFAIGKETSNDISLDSKDVLSYVKEFEERAKQVTG